MREGSDLIGYGLAAGTGSQLADRHRAQGRFGCSRLAINDPNSPYRDAQATRSSSLAAGSRRQEMI
jgi:hypothetical protein